MDRLKCLRSFLGEQEIRGHCLATVPLSRLQGVDDRFNQLPLLVRKHGDDLQF